MVGEDFQARRFHYRDNSAFGSCRRVSCRLGEEGERRNLHVVLAAHRVAGRTVVVVGVGFVTWVVVPVLGYPGLSCR